LPAISAKTRVIAVLGDPVSHSRSPAMHNAAFQALGLDFVYVALRVAPADLARAIRGIRTLGLAGLNVTVPHKERVLSLLDRLSTEAREIRAVNTVVARDGELIGHNTDAGGFLRAIGDLGFAPRGKRAVLLGAGGSARAVVRALARARVRRLTILNRTPQRAADLAQLARRLRPDLDVIVGPLGSAGDREFVGDADLVINGTSLGLDGRSQPPLAFATLRRGALVYDLVYGERQTPLVRAAARAGFRAADGRGMLLHQAALAFRVWTGRPAPLGEMARALGADRCS
jgi:shikimate dehydrogenase